MKRKTNKHLQQASFKGTGIISDQNIVNKIRQYMETQQFYQVQMAQVIKYIPNEQYGLIQCRLLFTQIEKQQQSLITMLPRDPFTTTIPVPGQVVLCSKHPIYDVDASDGMIMQQYYYFSVLNVLNKQNNNSVQNISHINQNQVPAEQDSDRLGGGQFYNNDNIVKTPCLQGDHIISGRYGHSIKFTYNRMPNGADMLPMLVLSNNHISLQGKQNQSNCGSLIRIQANNSQPQQQNKIVMSSKRNLLDQVNTFSNIGDLILIDSGTVVINSKLNDVQMYGNSNIQISSNNNIFMQSKNIKVVGDNKITFMVGDNSIVIDSSGVTITSPKITLNGQVQISGITQGSTPGFNSLPLCAFTGAPHTINIVGG